MICSPLGTACTEFISTEEAIAAVKLHDHL